MTAERQSFRPVAPLPAHGELLGSAVVKVHPEDFQVAEVPKVLPEGSGEHILLEIRKSGLTTGEAVRQLAAHLGVAPRAVSHAGLKDRQGVTSQWLSVHDPGGQGVPRAGAIDTGLEILRAGRHGRKLRTGALAGNRFRLRLRAVDAPRDAVDRRLARMAWHGVPNYFGSQRFGRAGANLDKALAWHRGEMAVRRRDVQGLLLSAARSEVFNRVLRRRVEAGTWNRAIPGDWMVLDGRGSVFAASDEAPARLSRRLSVQAIHPTGPMPGVGDALVSDRARAIEQAVMDECHELVALLTRRRVKVQRRALRLRVADLAWRWPARGVLELAFRLPPGAYATTVVAECFQIGDNSPNYR
ncbi:tRNA pseudouridine(13) synthase TruD [Arhodomonas sp. AD133]|uniref:tRNA pseudouridine(13) synthase TruD n=1 Tax=Arhodomonas sp. AD133 TaxID=3415009 RepID=UPI003EBE5249